MKALYIFIFLVLFSFKVQGQIKKDDLAHIQASAVIHSGSYIGLKVLFKGKGKKWIPIAVVNIIGSIKEISDSTEPHNKFDLNDMAYNNIGAGLSLGLIELGKLLKIPEEYSAAFVFGTNLIGLGVTVNF